mmetsp:Transcript_29485/g.60258  ORF Transcript_29485/g.60258 Transcript_29485/m.60258 type:complete len:281 (+) Transcript_29485:281-1123(+)
MLVCHAVPAGEFKRTGNEVVPFLPLRQQPQTRLHEEGVNVAVRAHDYVRGGVLLLLLLGLDGLTVDLLKGAQGDGEIMLQFVTGAVGGCGGVDEPGVGEDVRADLLDASFVHLLHAVQEVAGLLGLEGVVAQGPGMYHCVNDLGIRLETVPSPPLIHLNHLVEQVLRPLGSFVVLALGPCVYDRPIQHHIRQEHPLFVFPIPRQLLCPPQHLLRLLGPVLRPRVRLCRHDRSVSLQFRHHGRVPRLLVRLLHLHQQLLGAIARSLLAGVGEGGNDAVVDD